MVELLDLFWPGDIGKQLIIMNKYIVADWKHPNSDSRNIKIVGKVEWSKFLACFFAATVHGT